MTTFTFNKQYNEPTDRWVLANALFLKDTSFEFNEGDPDRGFTITGDNPKDVLACLDGTFTLTITDEELIYQLEQYPVLDESYLYTVERKIYDNYYDGELTPEQVEKMFLTDSGHTFFYDGEDV